MTISQEVQTRNLKESNNNYQCNLIISVYLIRIINFVSLNINQSKSYYYLTIIIKIQIIIILNYSSSLSVLVAMAKALVPIGIRLSSHSYHIIIINSIQTNNLNM